MKVASLSICQGNTATQKRGGGPEFKDDLLIVASYGIGAAAENRAGGDWKLIGCGSFESTRYILAIQPLFSLLFMEIPVIL